VQKHITTPLLYAVNFIMFVISAVLFQTD